MEKITFYHTLTCPQCKAVEILLKNKNITYVSVEDTDEIINSGIKSVPTLEVDGKLLHGKEIFDWVKAR